MDSIGVRFMYLETERMVLREFTMDDLQDFHEIFSDPEVMKNTQLPYELSKPEDFLRDFCINRDPKGGFAAVLKDSGKVIGYVLFTYVDDPEIYEIGWAFNKDYWRKGYAYEICYCLICFGFEDLYLHKIYAEATDFEKSVSMMKKLGMQLEGVQRKHTKSNEGEWCDLHLYAVLGEDFCRVV